MMRRTALFAAALSMIASATFAQDVQRVLSIGGSVTEIIYALGAQDKLIARDTTSVYPEAATELPNVGYIRALSPEGVLSVEPEIIISEAGAGPAETLEVLKNANIAFIELTEEYTPDGITDKIKTVGEALHLEADAEQLAAEVAADLSAAAVKIADIPHNNRKRVMFVLSAQGGRIMASGTNTAADGIITMAGGINAISNFEGYKPLTDEAVSNAQPDVILMMDREGDHSATADDFFALPAMVTTPAAQTKALVKMNGLYMLGFGPRTADAALELAHALYGEF